MTLRAIELGKGGAVALARSGHAIANFVGDAAKGADLIEKALLLIPNLAAGWFLGSFVKIMQGEPDGAISRVAYTMRLSPSIRRCTGCREGRRWPICSPAASMKPFYGPKTR